MPTRWSAVPQVEPVPEAVVWAPYWRSRRLFRVGMLGMIVSWLAAVAAYALVGDLALIAGGVAFLAFWACGVLGVVGLWSFRCPACGRRFGVAMGRPGWSQRCLHCGLPRDSAGT